MVRRDGNSLEKDAMLICRDMCICRRYLQNKPSVVRCFPVCKEPTILGVSLFVLGHFLGPLLGGPMSAIYGCNVVYRVSFELFFILMFSVALASRTCMYLYVPYVTPHVCVLSWTWWNNAIHAESCLLKFSVDVRVLWLSISQCD